MDVNVIYDGKYEQMTGRSDHRTVGGHPVAMALSVTFSSEQAKIIKGQNFKLEDDIRCEQPRHTRIRVGIIRCQLHV